MADTLGRRWLADGQGDLALGLGVAGQRVHQQQYVLALVAEVLGDPRAVLRGTQAHQRRVVGRRGDHHGALEAFLAEDLVDELLHLAAPLADQTDDDDVGPGEAGHHPQQHRLAHPGTGEQAEALAAADREQAIDRADADVERFADRVALERVDRRAVHRHPVFGAHSALAVEGAAGAIEHPAEHRHAHRQAPGVRQRHDPRAGRDAGEAADRHQVHLATGKAHHFGLHLHRVVAAFVDHVAAAADRGLQAFGFEGQADHAQQAALDHRLRRQRDSLGVALQAPGETGSLKAHRRLRGVEVDPDVAGQRMGRLFALLLEQLLHCLRQARLDGRVDATVLGLDAAAAGQQRIVLENPPALFVALAQR